MLLPAWAWFPSFPGAHRCLLIPTPPLQMKRAISGSVLLLLLALIRVYFSARAKKDTLEVLIKRFLLIRSGILLHRAGVSLWVSRVAVVRVIV